MYYDPDEIARKIAEYREQIDRLEQYIRQLLEYREQMERLEQYIRELLSLPVLDSEGNIVSYADLEA